MTSPLTGVLALLAVLLWAGRRRRPRVPGGPIIHRARLEAAEREVRRLPERAPEVAALEWGPRTPRSPIHL